MVSGDCKAAPRHHVDTAIARQMSDMIKAFRISQIVGTIAQLGIPDKLASGARTTGELASLIGCRAEATHRLMRAACELGLGASQTQGPIAIIFDERWGPALSISGSFGSIVQWPTNASIASSRQSSQPTGSAIHGLWQPTMPQTARFRSNVPTPRHRLKALPNPPSCSELASILGCDH